MTTRPVDERARAEASAAEWWQHEPFPADRQGHAYLCSRCGSPIAMREGTSRVGVLLLCGSCTDTAFPRSQAPPVPASPSPPQTPPTTVPVVQGPGGQPTPHRRRHWPWAIAGLAGVVAVGLIVTLLVWAPWGSNTPTASNYGSTGGPGAPTSVAITLTSGTAVLTWAPPQGGPSVDSYVILRDGVEVATVDGSTLQYVDTGLIPGEGHQYRLVAEADDERSALSDYVTATAPAPSPQLLRIRERARESMTLSWSAPPNAPQPERYSIVAIGSGEEVMSVDGTQTSAKVPGLDPGTSYAFEVVAVWGTNSSDPSTQASAITRVPPARAARLTGTMPITVKVTSTPGGSLTRGLSWTDSWTFSSACGSGACDAVLRGDITPPGNATHAFRVHLTRDGAFYTGQTRAHVTHCGDAPYRQRVRNMIVVRLHVTSGHLVNGEWLADSWAGTLTLRSPYTSAGTNYCPAQTVSMTLTGR